MPLLLSPFLIYVFQRRAFENCFEKTHRRFRSAIENLRLGGINFGRHTVVMAKALSYKPSISTFEMQHRRPRPTFQVGWIWDYYFAILCSPNEDFGHPNEELGTSFRMIFKPMWVLDVGDARFKTFDESFRRTFQWLISPNIVLTPFKRRFNAH